ncbi:MAG: PAS domain S-box protein [Dehalococcoidia bacterium]
MSNKPVQVLMVEDNPGDIRLIQTMLDEVSDQSFSLVYADCLKEGIEHLASNEPDVVLLDLGLPDSRGLDTLNKLQSQATALPVVILTGLYDEDIAIEAVKSGAQDYLVKGQATGEALARSLSYAIERKALEESLRESEEKYRNLVERSSDLIVILQDGVIKFANRQALNMLGYSAEEAIDTPVSEYISPEEVETVLENYNRRTSGETAPEKYETTLIHRDGSRVSVEVSGKLVRYKGKAADMVFLHDITARKRAEEELRAAHARLQEAHDQLKANHAQLLQSEKMASLGQLVSGVAHELNNPLMAISGYSELLANSLEDEKLARYSKNLSQETGRAIDIVRNLLSFARQHESTKERLSINDVLQSVMKLRSYEMGLDNVELEAILEPELPYVLGNLNQLQQALLNLITNAEQAIKEEKSSGRITVKTYLDNNSVLAEVGDDGPGIPQEVRERIFEPFYTTKEVGKGTGLGLSICYGIIQDHNGTISCHSNETGGTTFLIALPVTAEINAEQAMS